ncbi:MAG: PIN domain-containing protein [Tyzzerella sp.]|nr:PIN domain-containing protein [Tyzzerella sp.]
MNDKLKVYLDTSVISYLEQEDVPEKMSNTLELWEIFKREKYNLYISTVTLQEIEDCPEPKRSILYQYLSEIKYTIIDIKQMVSNIARQLIEMHILPSKSYDDCQHIAAAVEAGCDCIVSWNFKHIVNIKTIRGVRAITNLKGYKPIEILNPSVLLESEE